MEVLGANIDNTLAEGFYSLLCDDISNSNEILKKITGINPFFDTLEEFEICKNTITQTTNTTENRREFGDFQTNELLALNVCQLLKSKNIAPQTIIEPTCGKGSFILAALKTFPNAKKIIGIEIHKPYLWQAKFSILSYFLQNPTASKPEIVLMEGNIFDIKFDKWAFDENFLILGNPPWVTNAELTVLDSQNLPQKRNLKNHKGLDALTGKGNFDIGEFITLLLLQTFQHQQGHLAFLVKNAVVKNLIFDKEKLALSQVSGFEKYTINSQKEFNVSVDASLFFAALGTKPENENICREFDFYTQREIRHFGWHLGKFVAQISAYAQYQYVDGICPYEWRQGLKHDCSKVMELEAINDHFINGNGQEITIEQDLVYGILKSSDLKSDTIKSSRKNTIVTQRKIGQETNYIKNFYPKTWQYLWEHQEDFENRKSSIYVGKPPFSIFGIGDYAFAPYKVAISGLYKTSTFSLVLPSNDKPLMLDDTCYYLSFDNYEEALISQELLNSNTVQSFLQSIIFWDSKRAITKEVLSRIDLRKVIETFDYQMFKNNISYPTWEKHKQKLQCEVQLVLF